MPTLTNLRGKLSRAIKLTKLTGFAAASTLAEGILTAGDIEYLDHLILERVRMTFPNAAAEVDEHNRLVDEQSSCRDCGMYGRGYMLKDDVWREAVGDPHVLMCLPCVAALLGRPLVLDDFHDVSVNNALRYLGGLPPIDHRVPREDR